MGKFVISYSSGFDIELSDIISIINLLITSSLGLWIAMSVQNNLTTRRALKDYFIDEVKTIRSQYKDFIERLYNGQISAANIKEWLKMVVFT